jgi:hypothetical protein
MITERLRTHAAVRDVTVQVLRDLSGTSRVVAYVVPQPDVRLSETELRALVRAHLPRRCVPHRFVELASVPYDTEHRVHRSSLPSPYDVDAVQVQRQAPATESERLLAAQVEEILGITDVSMSENFFRIGGSSLLCFRVIENLRASTGRSLSPRSLLVGSLAQAAAELDAVETAVPTPVEATALPAATAAASGKAPASKGALSRLRGLIGGR